MRLLSAICGLVWLWAASAVAQNHPFRYNSYGAPGLIDMPGAFSAPDAELAFSISHFRGQTRNTATFQLSSGLSASFRYAALDNVLGQGDVVHDRILDRSFALHYRLSNETDRWPAVAVGVNDFLGTGIHAGEYVVATKALRSDLAVTAGLGWGRLAGVRGFDNPLGPRFGDRPDRDFGEGGSVSRNHFFKGDAALFGGLHWQIRDDLDVTLEYSSDAMLYADAGDFDRRSPVNIGLTYAPSENLRLSAHALYGSEVGAQLTYELNPRNPPFGGGLDRGPPPIRMAAGISGDLKQALQAEGLVLRGFERRNAVWRVTVANLRYMAAAQAVGRVARVLSNRAPAGITTFDITLMTNGIVGPAVTLQRTDLERHEFALDGAQATLDRAVIAASSDRPPRVPRADLQWTISPYLTPNIFDPDDPLRADIGVALGGSWSPRPGLLLSGTVRQRLVGNLDQTMRRSDSVLPRVRSDFALYDREGDADLIDLTATWYAQPHPTATTRLSVGLLEEAFGGVAAEVLWRPPDSAFAFGIELAQVRQRDYDSDFGFRDYGVATGHASAYWDMGGGYHVQIDTGRYLAGDWGGTLHVARRFRNGWEIGAFATLTDVPFADFGEGSFDKGITFSVPIAWLSGRPSRQTLDQTIRPVTRDGGARLNLQGRLYDLTRSVGKEAIIDSWARFWR
ncbi:YjbH domain-containing protein [Yoonia sp. 2307UL14-13]|uniref:YjbH domain-containing protein n=1 Tax=Yoonia sp. 2307UL14-13 TaxID=3126506 RepID=UPI003098BEE6